MVNNNSVSIDELRSNLADIVNRVTYAKEKIVVNKYNNDVAIIISLDEYEKLIDPTKRLSDEQWGKKFEKLDNIRAKIPQVDPKELDLAIDETVAEIRVEKKATNE